MRRFSRLLVVLAILLSGTVLVPYAAFPSERFGWQLFAGVYKPDLSVTKADSSDPVVAGDTLTYTLTITNNGPSEATGVTLADILPNSVTFGSATPSKGSCSGTSTVICDLGTLANSASATVTIIVTPTQVRLITNAAIVMGNEPDSNIANNLATEYTDISAEQYRTYLPTVLKNHQ
jgi:uncharacterized repeat protein (TIGR01451 family)